MYSDNSQLSSAFAYFFCIYNNKNLSYAFLMIKKKEKRRIGRPKLPLASLMVATSIRLYRDQVEWLNQFENRNVIIREMIEEKRAQEKS